jgi:hypothetical protein
VEGKCGKIGFDELSSRAFFRLSPLRKNENFFFVEEVASNDEIFFARFLGLRKFQVKL